MFKVEFDIDKLARKLSETEKKNLPYALANALNMTAFETRNEWARLAQTRFDRPTETTTGAVVYSKASKAQLGNAAIFLRDQARGGTPPSEYLKPEEFGGLRKQKGFERRLQRIPGGKQYYVPGRNAPLDQFGNLNPSLLRKIINELSATGGGEQPIQQAARRFLLGKGAPRKRRTGTYFLLRRPRGKLIAGAIYQRGAKGRGQTRVQGLKGILFPVSHAPRYRPRFGAIEAAKRIATSRFPLNFRRALERAVRSSR